MKALICGAPNTPYAHGCFEFDILCDNNYHRDPPKADALGSLNYAGGSGGGSAASLNLGSLITSNNSVSAV
jgi:hypothetical protein